MGKVRTKDEDPQCAAFKAIQLVQNRLLRFVNGTQIKDRVPTQQLLTKFNMSSVNQLNAQAKLLEVWKALNIEDYPQQIKVQGASKTGAITRRSTKGSPMEMGRLSLTQNLSTNDAIRIWNLSPASVTECVTLYQATKAIKTFARLLLI